MRDTPIVTFINKMDRDSRPPLELLDEIEKVLGLACAPITWPIGMGHEFQGVYHLLEDRFYLYSGPKDRISDIETVEGLHTEGLEQRLGTPYQTLLEEIELLQMAGTAFDMDSYRAAMLTPVFFGSAINNFGVRELLNGFVEWALPPQAHATTDRSVAPEEDAFSGFVFKIQANMDPQHRDRIAFMRVCSGKFEKGMKLRQVRIAKDVKIADALTFMASEREHVEEAYAGDIIGLHNHGTINIGDTFTQGEEMIFTGIPNFAPELFRRAVLRDPLRMKQLQKGLAQLCEEGATQLFRPLINNDLILGAVGQLQFEVVAHRLKAEYGVEARFEPVNVHTARWVYAENERKLDEFRRKAEENLALDHSDALVYIAPTRVNLALAEERWPNIEFRATREHATD